MKIQFKGSQQQKGFTIIELVVVILLLGILAATALPRFLDVTEEAHDAVVRGTASALQTGAALYRAQWVGQRQPAAGQQLTGGTEFNGLRTAASGYPIDAATALSTGGTFSATAGTAHNQCAAVYNGLLQAGRAPVSVSALATANKLAPVTPAVGTAETDANSDLFNITTGFVAKNVSGITTIGSLPANTILAADSFCVYVYAEDAARRSTVDHAVPAIVYFPNATTGTAPVEAGTVLTITL